MFEPQGGGMRGKLKVLKGIFFFLMGLIMIGCTGILICALNPSLTAMLAERVESVGSAQSSQDGQSGGLGGLFRDQQADPHPQQNRQKQPQGAEPQSPAESACKEVLQQGALFIQPFHQPSISSPMRSRHRHSSRPRI